MSFEFCRHCEGVSPKQSRDEIPVIARVNTRSNLIREEEYTLEITSLRSQ
jgi:hypothetical protein